MMPQLRDSGNHGSWQEARRSSQFQGFARIFGVETEYGVSVTGSDHPVDAAQVAMMMFQPVVSRARSTNTYLTNGSRLYLDVGSHPEYATAEARDPMDALLQDLAGERVMAGLALDAQARLRARYGGGVNVHAARNAASMRQTDNRKQASLMLHMCFSYLVQCGAGSRSTSRLNSPSPAVQPSPSGTETPGSQTTASPTSLVTVVPFVELRSVNRGMPSRSSSNACVLETERYGSSTEIAAAATPGGATGLRPNTTAPLNN